MTSSQEWFINCHLVDTVRHLTTRIEEHKKADSLVGLHLQQCSLDGNSADLSWETTDRSYNQTKILTLEAK